jgi:hypothetical protein
MVKSKLGLILPIFFHLFGSLKLLLLNVKLQVIYAIHMPDIFACFYCVIVGCIRPYSCLLFKMCHVILK